MGFNNIVTPYRFVNEKLLLLFNNMQVIVLKRIVPSFKLVYLKMADGIHVILVHIIKKDWPFKICRRDW